MEERWSSKLVEDKDRKKTLPKGISRVLSINIFWRLFARIAIKKNEETY